MNRSVLYLLSAVILAAAVLGLVFGTLSIAGPATAARDISSALAAKAARKRQPAGDVLL